MAKLINLNCEIPWRLNRSPINLIHTGFQPGQTGNADASQPFQRFGARWARALSNLIPESLC